MPSFFYLGVDSSGMWRARGFQTNNTKHGRANVIMHLKLRNLEFWIGPSWCCALWFQRLLFGSPLKSALSRSSLLRGRESESQIRLHSRVCSQAPRRLLSLRARGLCKAHTDNRRLGAATMKEWHRQRIWVLSVGMLLPLTCSNSFLVVSP